MATAKAVKLMRTVDVRRRGERSEDERDGVEEEEEEEEEEEGEMMDVGAPREVMEGGGGESEAGGQDPPKVRRCGLDEDAMSSCGVSVLCAMWRADAMMESTLCAPR